jgi:hypothetical protein
METLVCFSGVLVSWGLISFEPWSPLLVDSNHKGDE